MDLWDKGLFSSLLDNVEAEVGSRIRSCQPKDEEARAKSYNAHVLSGRWRAAVRNATSQGGGGVQNGQAVLEVLESKHPMMQEPLLDGSKDSESICESYDTVPNALLLLIAAETVKTVAGGLIAVDGIGIVSSRGAGELTGAGPDLAGSEFKVAQIATQLRG